MTIEEEAHPDPHHLPRQRRGVAPQGIGRYPDFDVLSQQGHWDEVTRDVVLDRVENVPSITWFDEAEAATLEAFCEVVTAQDAEPRIPVLAYIDEKLAAGGRDGWQYYDLPDDGDLWKLVAHGLDREAQHGGFESFAAAPVETQTGIVHRFSRADLQGRAWGGVNVARAWKVVMRYVVQAYYSHPWAWNEIGFGGPAYPRGYGAFGSPELGEKESWETRETAHIDPVRDVRERGLD